MRNLAAILVLGFLLGSAAGAGGQAYVVEFETPPGFGLGYRTSFYNADWNWSVDRLDLEGDGVLELPTYDGATDHLRVYDGATHALKWDHDLAENGGANVFLGFHDIDADGQREAVFDDGGDTGRVVIVDVALDAIELALDSVLYPTVLDIDNDSHPELIVEVAGDRTQIWGAGPASAAPPAHGEETNPSLACPNPFSGRVGIRIEAPAGTGEASLRIYDLRGRAVRTVIGDLAGAGRRTITWDGMDDSGRAAAAGVYLYEVQVGDLRFEGKTLLQR